MAVVSPERPLAFPLDAITAAPTRPTRPTVRPVQWGVLGVGVVAAAVLGYFVLQQGWEPFSLYLLGLGLGVVLFHSRFGFTSAWRQFVAVGQGRALRAHTLLLGATAILFTPILMAGQGVAGVPIQASVEPFATSVAVGALLFGLGMQIGGACASGTLFAVGSGNSAIVLTLGGFVAGSTVGAYNLPWWTAHTPSLGKLSLADAYGYAGALVITLAVLLAIALITYSISYYRRPPEPALSPSATGIARVLRGYWPLWVGALLLAVLNAAVLLISGQAWGITSAFALWGSKLLALAGGHPETWAYWQGSKAAALHGSVLADKTSLTDFGIMLGALIASATGGAFILHRRIPWRMALGAVLGGVLMGYGARLAYGCNIGAYLDGVASFSLHGWLWAVLALVGTWLGLKARPLFGLTTPKQSDSVC